MQKEEEHDDTTLRRLKRIRDRQIKNDGQCVTKFKRRSSNPQSTEKLGTCANCAESAGTLNERVRVRIPCGTDLIICRNCAEKKYPDIVKRMKIEGLIHSAGDEIKWRHATDGQTHAYHPTGFLQPLCKTETKLSKRDVDPVSMGPLNCKECKDLAARRNLK